MKNILVPVDDGADSSWAIKHVIDLNRDERVKVLSAVTAAPFDDIAAQLTAALTNPVRWRETLLALQELGAERFVEVGPGRVLTGLVKRTLRDVELVSA